MSHLIGIHNSDLTSEQIQEVPCIICSSKAGTYCVTVDGAEVPVIGYHKERIALRKKLPILPRNLTADDKNLITYYAYVMLADACAEKSVEMLGKKFTSLDVQKFFAKQAIEELKKDGLLT